MGVLGPVPDVPSCACLSPEEKHSIKFSPSLETLLSLNDRMCHLSASSMWEEWQWGRR